MGQCSQAELSCGTDQSRHDFEKSPKEFALPSRPEAEKAQDLEERTSNGAKLDQLYSHYFTYGGELTNPSRHERSFKTDILSLARGLNNEGITCQEIVDAICVTAPAFRHPERPDQLPVRPEGQVFVEPSQASLLVPDEFSSLRYDWTAPSASQVSSSSDQETLQSCMGAFMSAMLSGIMAQLRLEPDEGTGTRHKIDVALSIAKDLKVLVISGASIERRMPLSSVRWVRPSDGVDRDLMVFMRLEGGRFLRIEFEHKGQAAFFGTCMRLLLKDSRSTGSGPR